MTFSERLKSFRKSTGMSQEKLAQLLGVSFVTINKWESGKGNPTKLTQLGVEKILNDNE